MQRIPSGAEREWLAREREGLKKRLEASHPDFEFDMMYTRELLVYIAEQERDKEDSLKSHSCSLQTRWQ